MFSPLQSLLRVFIVALVCAAGGVSFATAPKAPVIVTTGIGNPQITTSLLNGSKGILIRWEDKSDDEDFFVVYSRQGTTGDFGRSTQVSANSTHAAIIPITKSFTAGTTFQFAVAACKGTFSVDRNLTFDTNGWAIISEQSAKSGVVSVSWPAGPSAFEAPSDLKAESVDDGHVKFTFIDHADSEEAFELQLRATSATSTEADWKTLKQFFGLSGDFYWPFDLVTNVLAIGLDPGKGYDFRLRALRTAAGSTTTTEATAWSPTATFVMPGLSAPTGLVGETDAENTVTLSWTDKSENEQGFLVENRVHSDSNPGTFATYATLGSDTTRVVINPFEDPGVAYDWRISAAFQTGTTPDPNNSGKTIPVYSTASSSAVQLTTYFNAPTALQTPVINNDPSLSKSRVTLSWTDNSNVESGFELSYLAPGASDYTIATSTGPSSSLAPAKLSFTLSDELPAGKTMPLRIRAFVPNGTSRIYSGSVSASITTKDAFLNAKDDHLHPSIIKDTAFTKVLKTTNDAGLTLDSNNIPKMTVSNLPAGLTFNAATKTISGTPTEAGLFLCPITAEFVTPTTTTDTLQLRVLNPQAAPIKPKTFATRTISTQRVLRIPLSDLFADPDTEQALAFTFQRGSNTLETVNVILYPSLAPDTVNKFMQYVDAADYDNVAVQRKVTDFIIQMGSYKYLPLLSAGTTPRFSTVLARSSPQNEPGISNLAGTIAMAKVGGFPNSASHDFFFNLNNNTGPYKETVTVLDTTTTDPNDTTTRPATDSDQVLDLQNGGFTVFGRVATGGMDVLTEIESLKVGSYSLRTYDPRGGLESTSASGADFPVMRDPAPAALLSTDLVLLKSVKPVTDLLPIQTLNSSDTAKVTVAKVNGNVEITGVAAGTSTVTIIAKDLDGNTTTQTIAVTVDDAYALPTIATHPKNASVAAGGTAEFKVVAAGNDLHFQWLKDGDAISNGTVDGTVITGADTATLKLTGLHLSDQARYSVVVSNEAAELTSNSASLLVLQDIDIVTQPTISGSISPGATVTMFVEATGGEPLTYQWLHGASPIRGATSPTYTIVSARFADEGSYSVTISNPSGSKSSDPASLTLEDFDNDKDGLRASEEETLGTDPANADTDGDGYPDGVEKTLGSNPLLAASTPAAAKGFVAAAGQKEVLGNVLMRRIPASTTPATSAYWLGAYELTNKQFASVLQRALSEGWITIVRTATGNRRYVSFSASSGVSPIAVNTPICYLTDTEATLPSDAPATDISTIDRDTQASGVVLTETNRIVSFTVPAASATQPVRAVSWSGAYLAAMVLNKVHGYTAKNSAADFTFTSGQDGYRVPGTDEWTAAANGGRVNAAAKYPTGATATTAMAWFGQTATTAKPKNVGSYAANPFGCFDLGGNVAEWVFDLNGLSNSLYRGGSYADALASLENASHPDLARTTIDKRIGIRLALDAPATPTIATNPASRLIRTDEELVLTTSATGAPPIAYQWLRNNVVVAGQTSGTLRVAKPVLANAGKYQTRVTSSGINPVTSTPALVSIVEQPVKTAYVVNSYTNVTLTVPYAAAPGETLSFVWYKNGAAMSNRGSIVTGTASNALTIKNCQTVDSAIYTCEVSAASAVPSVAVGFSLRVLGFPTANTPIFTDTLMVSESFNYQVTYNTSSLSTLPTKFTATGLPPGLKLDPVTGIISGKPTAAGTYTVLVTVSNSFGSFSTSSVELTVKSLELIKPNAIGTFFGLISNHTGLAPDTGINDDLGGRIDLTVAKTGAFTGKTVLGTVVYNFTGALDVNYNANNSEVNPTALVIIPRKGKTSLALLLDFDVTGAQTLSGFAVELTSAGQLSNSNAVITGWRYKWNAVLAPASAYKGLHNIALRIPSRLVNNAGLPAGVTVPQGSGYAAVNVSVAGATSVVGKLPDGTAISFASFLGPVGQQPLFQVLYAGKGSVVGVMTEEPARSLAAESFQQFTGTDSLLWLKKDLGTTSKDRSYKRGFEISLTPVGGKYEAPVAPNLIMGLTAPSSLAQLDFADGGLSLGAATSFQQDVTITSPAVTSFVGLTNTYSVTCKITGANGFFTGTFKLPAPDGRVVTYQGMVVSDPDHPGKGFGEGYFLLPGLAGGGFTALTSPILSGWVGLDKK